jgi:hypothetical protein
MPFVPIDSPIRQIPTSLSRREILYLDGIRYCFEIFELVSLRLARTLQEIGQRDDATNPIAPLIVEATTDAWTLIDTTHRLRELLQQTPKLKKNESELQLFLRRSESIEKLRNYFQHFRTEIHSFADRGMPLWGTLSWIYGGDSSELPSNHCIIPGTFFEDCRAMGCVFDTHEGRFVERVVMHAGPIRIDLVDLHDAVERFVRFYINWFEQTFKETERHGADVHFQLTLKPVFNSKSNCESAIAGTDQSQPLPPTIVPNSDENP